MPQKTETLDGASRGAIWLAAAVLVGAILVAYHNSFSGPFVFDDTAAISGNPSIRDLSNLGNVLSPPREGGQTVGGRPVVNLSLAINYAIGGASVRSYHVFNFAVHVAAALVLFGIVRRTLGWESVLQWRWREHTAHGVCKTDALRSTWLAAVVALLWAVHPLQTESVTYVIQRAESLMGLFYLLTLYCFMRGVGASLDGAQSPVKHGHRQATPLRSWFVLSWVACFLGMATKEVMVSAPLIVLLYDRTFVAGSWRAAWAARRFFYVSLASTWLVLGRLVLGAENRGGTAGLGLGDSVWSYALTQTRAIVTYLKLACWPRPLVFDYGTEAIEDFSEALPFAILAVAMLAGAVWALWRRPFDRAQGRPVLGFVAAWFFAILAPSSSFVPVAVQPMAEHRMYLPLAAVVALTVVGVYLLWRRGWWVIFSGAAVGLMALTVARNDDFRSATAIWADTVAKRPANARAQCYLGDALAADGRWVEALSHYDEAIRLDRPAVARGHRSISNDVLVNSGNVLRALGRNDEAVKRYEEALRIDPKLVAAHFNLGAIHLQTDRLPAAIEQLEQALKIDPNYSAAHTSLGSALLLAGRGAEALGHYEAALRLDPSAKSQRDLGLALLFLQRVPEAIGHLEEAVRLAPDSAQAHEFLGNALAAQGRKADAVTHYQRALQLTPGNERVRRALEGLLATSR